MVVVIGVVIPLPAFHAASAGVGSGRGGMGGGGEDVVGGIAGVRFAVLLVGCVGGAVGGAAWAGAWQVGAGFFVGAGRTTRGSLATGGLDAKGIWGGLAGARAAGAVLPCLMAVNRTQNCRTGL